MNKDLVNRKNTKTWVKCNDNSKSHIWREYEFTDSSGTKHLVTNFSKFCRENELNKAAMYGVMNGTRNHHKGFVCKKLT